jgi:hypothetical protein
MTRTRTGEGTAPVYGVAAGPLTNARGWWARSEEDGGGWDTVEATGCGIWDENALLVAVAVRPEDADGIVTAMGLLARAVDAWPQFNGPPDVRPEVSGADLVEWFDAWRREAAEVVGLAPTPAEGDNAGERVLQAWAVREDGPAYPDENHACPVCGGRAFKREAACTCTLIEFLDDAGAVTEWETEDVSEEEGPDIYLTCDAGHIWEMRAQRVIDGEGYSGQVVLLPTAADHAGEGHGAYGRKRLRTEDVRRLAASAGLELDGRKGPGYGPGCWGFWALCWRDAEGHLWHLDFSTLWEVEAYLLAEREAGPGPVAVQDLLRALAGRPAGERRPVESDILEAAAHAGA